MRKSRSQESEVACPRHQVRSGRPLVTSLCMIALLYQLIKPPLPSRWQGHSSLQGGTVWRVKCGEDCSVHLPFQQDTPWISGPLPLCSAAYIAALSPHLFSELVNHQHFPNRGLWKAKSTRSSGIFKGKKSFQVRWLQDMLC